MSERCSRCAALEAELAIARAKNRAAASVLVDMTMIGVRSGAVVDALLGDGPLASERPTVPHRSSRPPPMGDEDEPSVGDLEGYGGDEPDGSSEVQS
jgi:hypothetical protein